VTPGQQRALRELALIQSADPDALEIIGEPKEVAPWVIVHFSLRIGLLETREGGLEFREREHFLLSIPEDFPFDKPSLWVDHDRFAGFPHVCWKTSLCMYQSPIEWNPSDGLFGFFDRLTLWLTRAARNDMDPIEGPLEPPHHITDYSHDPVVIRANAPGEPGSRWIGWAHLEKLPSRLELVAWSGFDNPLPPSGHIAPAIFLSEPLPMEFPRLGRDLFDELLRRGVTRDLLLSLLAMSALVTPEGEPARIVIGLPMRRAHDGSIREHISVWATASNYAESLRRTVPKDTDSAELRVLRDELADSIYRVFESTDISWCPVLEDRDEILVRRDSKTPMAWFSQKRVLVLGCGGIGSWVAEMIARARPAAIDIVDNAIVKPGILARQNFVLEDIGSSKADALVRRLKSISTGSSITGFKLNAHRFVLSDLNRLSQYDIVVDCTASSIVAMKLERDWSNLRSSIRCLVSFVIDAQAQRMIAVSLSRESAEGPWSAYNRLKYKLTAEENRPDIAAAFYAPGAADALFQPEPGCSDPTFSGSMGDVSRLAATALNVFAGSFSDEPSAQGIACALPNAQEAGCRLDIFSLPAVHLAVAEPYRVLISTKVLNQARACVRQNQRLRSAQHETGGLLWGYWDDAARVILVLDASGPPPDSKHDPGHFICGTSGTEAEHRHRAKSSFGACSFIGLWHTHPEVPPMQSAEDIHGMTTLVARAGQNRRRALMLIFGRTAGIASAGIFVYEGQAVTGSREMVRVGLAQLALVEPVV
jgi:hypothetical protein